MKLEYTYLFIVIMQILKLSFSQTSMSQQRMCYASAFVQPRVHVSHMHAWCRLVSQAHPHPCPPPFNAGHAQYELVSSTVWKFHLQSK